MSNLFLIEGENCRVEMEAEPFMESCWSVANQEIAEPAKTTYVSSHAWFKIVA